MGLMKKYDMRKKEKIQNIIKTIGKNIEKANEKINEKSEK